MKNESVEIISFGPNDRKELKDFVKLPWVLYNPLEPYVPPPNMFLLGNRLLGAVGLLTSQHPFHEHSQVIYFLAKRGKKVLGRVAACINRNYIDYHNEKAGFFGFYELINDREISHMLLGACSRWLRKQGMRLVYGPCNFSSNETWGLLIDSFDMRAFIETPYNKPYYRDFIEEFGFVKAKDLYAQIMPVKDTKETKVRRERLDKIAEKIQKRHNVTIRPIDMKNMEADVDIVHEIHNIAWKDNWGHIPMTKGEVDDLKESLKFIVDPAIFNLIFVGDDPAAFLWAMPDLNEMIQRKRFGLLNTDLARIVRIILKKNKVRRMRLVGFGIKPEYRKLGLDAVIIRESFRNTQKRDCYEECELSWLLEDNVLILRLGEALNAKKYRTWRIFQKNL